MDVEWSSLIDDASNRSRIVPIPSPAQQDSCLRVGINRSCKPPADIHCAKPSKPDATGSKSVQSESMKTAAVRQPQLDLSVARKPPGKPDEPKNLTTVEQTMQSNAVCADNSKSDRKVPFKPRIRRTQMQLLAESVETTTDNGVNSNPPSSSNSKPPSLNIDKESKTVINSKPSNSPTLSDKPSASVLVQDKDSLRTRIGHTQVEQLAEGGSNTCKRKVGSGDAPRTRRGQMEVQSSASSKSNDKTVTRALVTERRHSRDSQPYAATRGKREGHASGRCLARENAQPLSARPITQQRPNTTQRNSPYGRRNIHQTTQNCK